MTTAATIGIVAVAGVGVFVLLKLANPSPVVPLSKAKSGTDVLSINSLSKGGQTNEGTYHTDTSGFSISGNTLLDDSGNAVTYGTDY